jgi:hypothetical protein
MSFNICGRQKSESASLTDEEGDGFVELRDDMRKCESLCFQRTLWLISSQTSLDYKTCFCFSLQNLLLFFTPKPSLLFMYFLALFLPPFSCPCPIMQVV